MKFKKSLVKVIVVGSIFFISSMSFGGLVSLQDDNLNNFWTVGKLDMSFVNTSYAESGGGESGGRESGGSRSYKKESGGDKKYSTTQTLVEQNNIQTTQISEPIEIIEKKKIELSEEEKKGLKDRFKKVYEIINKKYDTDTKKLNSYQRLNLLLEEKIATLELIKINITNESLLEKYEKKILLFNELNLLTQESILIYIDSIELEEEINTIKKQETIGVQIKDNSTVDNVSTQKLEAEKARIEAEKLTEVKRLENLRKQVEEAKAIKAAKDAETARLAKIEADRIAAENAKIAAEKAAAQAAAKAAADANTRAS